IFWEHPLRGVRRLYYNVIQEGDFTTATIQPPMLAWAWRIAVGDPAREPAIVAHHDFVMRERDLEGDGLLWLIQPDESGLDASPQFDPIWRRRAQGLPGFVELVHHNRRLGFRIAAVRAAGGPVVCEVLTNVLHGLSRLALLRLGYGEHAAALADGARSAVLQSGLREFYDPHDGRGMGASEFAWSALALELLDPDHASARSHLGDACAR